MFRIVPLEIFHSYGDVILAIEILQFKIIAIEHEMFTEVPHELWHETSVCNFRYIFIYFRAFDIGVVTTYLMN